MKKLFVIILLFSFSSFAQTSSNDVNVKIEGTTAIEDVFSTTGEKVEINLDSTLNLNNIDSINLNNGLIIPTNMIINELEIRGNFLLNHRGSTFRVLRSGGTEGGGG